MSELPFESWHPDAKRRCGYWIDIAINPCYRCDTCREKFNPLDELKPYVKSLHDIIKEYRSIVRNQAPALNERANQLLKDPIVNILEL